MTHAGKSKAGERERDPAGTNPIAGILHTNLASFDF